MKITFLMPCYMWVPSGGFRVVYEYANRMVARGHQVTVVHPRRLKFPRPPSPMTLRGRVRVARFWIRERISKPIVDWHPIDPRINMSYVPDSSADYIPDADVFFATGWDTVASVLACPAKKGEKCYLIQGYEALMGMGPKELVDATWRAPLHKVVIARWLMNLGESLGCSNLTYIPNGIDQRYRMTRPFNRRLKRVVMMCSFVRFKGSPDGIKALEIVKGQIPDLDVRLFGNSRRPPWVPAWMSYSENPPQGELIDDIYNTSSIFLGPSLTEGFPLPPAEAAACGCAIVATDIGGHTEYLEHEVTALLCPPKNPEELARNLCRLLNDDELRIRLATAANKNIAQFTWERSADLFEAFLKRAKSEQTLPSDAGLTTLAIDAVRDGAASRAQGAVAISRTAGKA
jgi:L-malate glycosyltransferase